MAARSATSLFIRALSSGYLLIGITAGCSILAVPLALSHLSTEQFGLWALAAQMTAYYALIDLGMTTSISRHLVEYKDDRASGRYGAVLQISAYVTLFQGVAILVIGTILTWALRYLLIIPSHLVALYGELFIAQTAVIGLTFGSKIFNHILASHQRFDLSNFFGAINQITSLICLWVFFTQSFGLLSYPLATFCAWLVSISLSATACFACGLIPRTMQEWGSPRWSDLRELFSFGGEIFVMSIASQVIFGSQTILLTRFLGLGAAASWAVCTKPFMLVCQLVWKLFEFAYIRFAELNVRKEFSHLLVRSSHLRDIIWLASGMCAALLMGLNSDFISLWTGQNNLVWSRNYDSLLGVWLIILSMSRCDLNFIISQKCLGRSSVVLVVEAVVFIGLTLAFISSYGIGAMLVASIAASTLFSFSYNRKMRLTVYEKHAQMSTKPAGSLVRPMLFMAFAFLIGRLSQHFEATNWLSLVVKASTLISILLPAAWILGMPRDLRSSLSHKLLQRFIGKRILPDGKLFDTKVLDADGQVVTRVSTPDSSRKN